MRRLLAALFAVSAVIACDSVPTGTVNSADAGNYVLRTLNDSGLPFLYASTPTSSFVILADTIFMGVDGSFTDKTYSQLTQNGTTTSPVDVSTGTWTERGSVVTFKQDGGGGDITAALQGNQLVIVGDGRRAVYTK
jgi:hypothetical protein